MHGNADDSSGHHLTAGERRSHAERAIRDATETARAQEQQRYRAGTPDDGGRSLGGTLFALAGGAGIQGGYRLDPDELAGYIQRFERIADRVEKQTIRWKNAADHAIPPSADPPATRQAERTRESCVIGLEANEAKLRRINAFVESMKSAHGGYQRLDDETSDTYRKTSADDGRHSDTGGLFKKQSGDTSRADTGSLFEKRTGQ